MRITSTPQPPTLRVLTVLDDVNGGHGSAADAVHHALEDLSAGIYSKVYNFYQLSTPERQLQRRQEDAARVQDMQPDLVTGSTDQPQRSRLRHRLGNAQQFIARHTSRWRSASSFPLAEKIVRRENPDIILSVHPDTNHLSAEWRHHGATTAPTHCLITDFVGAGWWTDRNIQRYYVANDQVRTDMEEAGVPTDKIKVIGGLPLAPAVTAADTRPTEQVKKALGLDPDRPVVLVVGGSNGYAKYGEILEGLQARGNTAQVVALCGRDGADGRNPRREEVEAAAPKVDFPVHARGFVEMPDYYHVADVVVTKPGGLTTAECLARGKAMVLVNPIREMEKTQADRLVEAQVATFAHSPQQTAALAIELLGDDGERHRLEQAATNFSVKNAAHLIAQDLIDTAREGAAQ